MDFQGMKKTKISPFRKGGAKQLMLLLDPASVSSSLAAKQAVMAEKAGFDYILVGGSLVSERPDAFVAAVKKVVKLPVLLFPGSPLQICPEADGILFLSLISGRNPEFLIGQHVVAAPFVKQCGLQVFSVGYMLIGDEHNSSVSYMSGTVPIPSSKPEIAVATALAGEMLGLGAIYLEAGSGAGKKVPAETIKAVAQNTKIPVIVGGGMKITADIKTAFRAGADIVVVGTAVENDSAKIRELAKAKKTS